VSFNLQGYFHPHNQPWRFFNNPFTDINDHGLFGVFEDVEKSAKIIKLIDEAKENADIA